ncbi:MAG TPA: FAD-linked oxidase C-terminal domain-containing protein [bacterium]|nr:FAD-linked oxidase C-terminal domain-containing protein [bacterium]
MFNNALIQQFRDIVGAENVFDSKADRICYSYDATKQSFLPDLVVRPGSTADVSAVMKLASERNIPVYPRGAGSGLTGGAVPLFGGIALDMVRMNRIIEIDADNLTATVEPGLVVGEFQKKVEEMGLFYPPDPASNEFSTIGGNVAECAGGLRCLKYGVTRDYVLGLEVVLSNGDVINLGVRTLKSVTGYDMVRLFVGSEGTLGVFTKIILRLIPLPERLKTCNAFFADTMDAARAIADIIRNRVVPRTFEFMDRKTIECVERYKNVNISEGKAAAFLLIEVDGIEASVEVEMKKIVDICTKNGAYKTQVAKDEKERELLWSLRKAVSPALYQISPGGKINEDVCVPRSKIPDMLSRVADIAARHQVTIVSFGHAGDGNIHMNVLVDFDKPEELKRGEEAIEEVFKATIELGGTLSGEHGIGNTKAKFLHLECGEEEIELMREVKELFDPKGILNPGKIFDPSKQRVLSSLKEIKEKVPQYDER